MCQSNTTILGGEKGYGWELGGVEGGCELGQHDVTRTLGPPGPPPARPHLAQQPPHGLAVELHGRQIRGPWLHRPRLLPNLLLTEAAKAQKSTEDGPRPFQLADSRRTHAWAVLGPNQKPEEENNPELRGPQRPARRKNTSAS